MEWLVENWLTLLIVILLVGMHIFGHGRHGKSDDSDKSSGHRH